MSLTVPTSGDIGGRSASVQIATPDTGAVISEFGNKMAELGKKWIGEQTDFQTRSNQLSMTSDLANVRLQAEQAGDPVAAGQIWDSGSAEVLSKYLPVDANGNSTLNPKQAQDLQLTFQELKGQHTFALAEKSVSWTRSQASANWIKSRDTILTKSVSADDESFAAYIKLGESEINAQEAQGLMNPADAEIARQALRQDAYRGRADALIDSDPQAFLDAADAHKFDALGGELLSSRVLDANNEKQRRIKAADEEATRQTAQAKTGNDKQLRDMIDLTSKSVSPAQRDLLNNPEFVANADPALVAEARTAISLLDEQPTLGDMSLPELDDQIRAEEAAPKTQKFQVERLEFLNKLRAAKAGELVKDAAGWAQKSGKGFEPLPDFDPQQPEVFSAALQARLTDADVMSKREGIKVNPLTVEEQKGLKDAIALQADPRTKAEMAAVLGATFGMAKVAALSGDQTFAWVSGLATAGGSKAMAAEILKGQARVKADNIQLPPLAERLDQNFQEIGSLVGDMGGQGLQSQIFLTTDALYAARVQDPTADFDADIYTQALHDVLGGTGITGTDEATGGVAEIRNVNTLLPMGVSARDVETALDGLPTDQATLDQLMQGISRTGQPPMIDGEPVPLDDLAEMHIEAVGNDSYRFVTDQGYTPEAAPGVPFEFSMIGTPKHRGLLFLGKETKK